MMSHPLKKVTPDHIAYHASQLTRLLTLFCQHPHQQPDAKTVLDHLKALDTGIPQFKKSLAVTRDLQAIGALTGTPGHNRYTTPPTTDDQPPVDPLTGNTDTDTATSPLGLLTLKALDLGYTTPKAMLDNLTEVMQAANITSNQHLNTHTITVTSGAMPSLRSFTPDNTD